MLRLMGHAAGYRMATRSTKHPDHAQSDAVSFRSMERNRTRTQPKKPSCRLERR